MLFLLALMLATSIDLIGSQLKGDGYSLPCFYNDNEYSLFPLDKNLHGYIRTNIRGGVLIIMPGDIKKQLFLRPIYKKVNDYGYIVWCSLKDVLQYIDTFVSQARLKDTQIGNLTENEIKNARISIFHIGKLFFQYDNDSEIKLQNQIPYNINRIEQDEFGEFYALKFAVEFTKNPNNF